MGRLKRITNGKDNLRNCILVSINLWYRLLRLWTKYRIRLRLKKTKKLQRIKKQWSVI